LIVAAAILEGVASTSQSTLFDHSGDAVPFFIVVLDVAQLCLLAAGSRTS
jgi:hypothetical protein